MLNTVGRFIYIKYWGILYVEHSGEIIYTKYQCHWTKLNQTWLTWYLQDIHHFPWPPFVKILIFSIVHYRYYLILRYNELKFEHQFYDTYIPGLLWDIFRNIWFDGFWGDFNVILHNQYKSRERKSK
jgi:hypothetical protein